MSDKNHSLQNPNSLLPLGSCPMTLLKRRVEFALSCSVFLKYKLCQCKTFLEILPLQSGILEIFCLLEVFLNVWQTATTYS